jgi:hypothetical protein
MERRLKLPEPEECSIDQPNLELTCLRETGCKKGNVKSEDPNLGCFLVCWGKFNEIGSWAVVQNWEATDSWNKWKENEIGVRGKMGGKELQHEQFPNTEGLVIDP